MEITQLRLPKMAATLFLIVFQFQIFGVIENTFGQEIIVFPNPTAGDLTIDLGEIHSTILTKTLSLNGQLINENSFNNTQMLDRKY